MTTDTIKQSDIERAFIFDWVCPKCADYNKEYDEKPKVGDKVYCDYCKSYISVVEG